MSEGAEDQFIVEGIRRYAQALETIQTFETMLGDRLREVAKAYSCKVFSPTTAPIATGTSEGAFGHLVWASQEGAMQSKAGEVWLELGVWWRDDQVAYYCGFVDGANKALDFDYVRNHPRVEFRKWSRKARLFMLALSDPKVALDDEFRILLDELAGSFQ